MFVLLFPHFIRLLEASLGGCKKGVGATGNWQPKTIFDRFSHTALRVLGLRPPNHKLSLSTPPIQGSESPNISLLVYPRTEISTSRLPDQDLRTGALYSVFIWQSSTYGGIKIFSVSSACVLAQVCYYDHMARQYRLPLTQQLGDLK